MRGPRLSILCVTRAEPHATPFLREMVRLGGRLRAELVLAVDGPAIDELEATLLTYAVRVHSQGFIESVLDEAIGYTTGDYVLRLDDDERCSPAMEEWLAADEHRAAEHWSFPTANLWTPTHLILNPPLWPNLHQRLSRRSLAGGRPKRPHGRSPYPAMPAPVVFEHHKFVAKTVREREAIAARYEALRPGSGLGHHLPYNLPERAYESLRLAPVGDGRFREWSEDEIVVEPMRRAG